MAPVLAPALQLTVGPQPPRFLPSVEAHSPLGKGDTLVHSKIGAGDFLVAQW